MGQQFWQIFTKYLFDVADNNEGVFHCVEALGLKEITQLNRHPNLTALAPLLSDYPGTAGYGVQSALD